MKIIIAAITIYAIAMTLIYMIIRKAEIKVVLKSKNEE